MSDPRVERALRRRSEPTTSRASAVSGSVLTARPFTDGDVPTARSGDGGKVFPKRAAGGRLEELAGRVGSRALELVLRPMRGGPLTVSLPDGRDLRFGESDGPSRAGLRLQVRRWRFFRRVLLGGDLGFAESYIDGDWHTDDLADVLALFAANRDRLGGLSPASAWLRQRADRALHVRRADTLADDRRNIQDHYDLGDELFRNFLDPSMTYSCALFERPGESLEDAQLRKLDAVIDKAGIGPRDRVLEIGSGWGSFAFRAVERTGCRVTTVTLSEQQFRHVQQRARAGGLAGRIEPRLCDYREVRGSWDKIVSIEMLEAVGHDRLGTFFSACDRLLARGGRAVIQVITIRDDLYDSYRKSVDFIRRHIFPGGHLPSRAALVDAIATSSGLAVEDIESIGHHYVPTLRTWRERLLERRHDLLARGFDSFFLRKWEYYLAYSETGFTSGMLDDLQMVLATPPTRRIGERET